MPAMDDAASTSAQDGVGPNPPAGTETLSSADSMDASALQALNVDTDVSDSAIGGMTPEYDMEFLQSTLFSAHKGRTSTMSVNSSVYDYVEENGRTYHRYKEGKYMLPNDEVEMDRLDLQHQLWLITLSNQLHLCPVTNPQNVVDIATGTGIWAIEFAIKHPSARVIGFDLSPIQPDYVPQNCSFEVDDAEDEWNYSVKFDLIHARATALCFNDPGKVIHSAFDSLKPGGYLEFQDLVLPLRAIDDTLQGTAISTWQDSTIKAAANLGMSWKNSDKYVQYFEAAGFKDVTTKHFQWPINTWPKGKRLKLLGAYFCEDMISGLDGLSMAALTRGGGMTREQVLELTTKAKKDLANRRIHAYLPIVVVYGQKPL